LEINLVGNIIKYLNNINIFINIVNFSLDIFNVLCYNTNNRATKRLKTLIIRSHKMNRINTATVYVVILIWAGIVLLYSISGAGSNSALAGDATRRNISAIHKISSAPGFDSRLNSLTPLYY